MACQVQNQYQPYEQSGPLILAHHELVLKKLSALSMYMEAQGKGASDGVSGPSDGPNLPDSEAARDWYGEGNSHSISGQSQPQRSAARPIPPPSFQFSAQSAAPPLSTSAPSVNPFSHSSPSANPALPRVASFSNGWHENVKPDRGRESLAASAARFYEQKRRASIASHKALSLNSHSLRSPPEHGNCPPSPLGRSHVHFYPRECSQDSLEKLGSSGFSARRSSPGASSGDGGFFFAPGDKHRVLSHFSPSPTSSLSSILSAGGSGDSNPVSPNRTDSDGSGNSCSMDGATKPLARNWDMEAESALAKGGERSCGAEEDKLAPLVGRGLRRGLSQHYGGKSRSFHSLADVVTSPIQHLAKPENSYAKRRKNNNGSHSNLLGRASGGVGGNYPQKAMLADNLGFRDSEMNDVEGEAFEWAAEGADVATALRPMAQFQPLRSQSMADLRAIGRRRSHPEY
ncbi:hypothetical protein KFL_001780060 [Klebsormidium nitens]|uniref:Uncharacterized protein n=1 Tax=Klebsormidium nitens TaxID=105231 RepID=A0A1Y1I4Q6_KLENI|nr:hypothetical protein KFL_001780060 [Klebsormidium nitens]|eukprot:GAQ84151.1 hypothetical protein KFL_001780060 [Klebsormidium nitens]